MARYSFTDKRGRKVNVTDHVKVVSAPNEMKEFVNTEAMVMSVSLGGIVMLHSESPQRKPHGGIFYMKEDCLEFHRTH